MIKLSDITVGLVDKRILNETRYRAKLVVKEEDIISDNYTYKELKSFADNLRLEVWNKIYKDLVKKVSDYIEKSELYCEWEDSTELKELSEELINFMKPK